MPGASSPSALAWRSAVNQPSHLFLGPERIESSSAGGTLHPAASADCLPSCLQPALAAKLLSADSSVAGQPGGGHPRPASCCLGADMIRPGAHHRLTLTHFAARAASRVRLSGWQDAITLAGDPRRAAIARASVAAGMPPFSAV